jgi:N-acetylmuramoyl-L-alanine amidase
MINFLRANTVYFVLISLLSPLHFLYAQITPESLVAKYNQADRGGKPVRILIVPGHEPSSGGAEFIGLAERDMTVYTAEKLAAYLKEDKHLEPILARDYYSWNTTLSDYFMNNWEAVRSFRDEHIASMKKSVSTGVVAVASGAKHNVSSEETSVHLFGINKWVGENGIDLVIHVHFNDFPDHGPREEGKYSGVVVYIPEKQYTNATASRAIAEKVFAQMNRFHSTSTLPHERAGVSEDQTLTAIGAYNTLRAPSLLIEYGYIYEPQFWYGPIRRTVMTDSAYETYLGLIDFFNATNTISSNKTSTLFPKKWTAIPGVGKHDMSVYLLQKALTSVGVYPPKGETLYTCPLTGKVGGCTKRAIVEFQKSQGIKEAGFGVKTRAALEKVLK